MTAAPGGSLRPMVQAASQRAISPVSSSGGNTVPVTRDDHAVSGRRAASRWHRRGQADPNTKPLVGAQTADKIVESIAHIRQRIFLTQETHSFVMRLVPVKGFAFAKIQTAQNAMTTQAVGEAMSGAGCRGGRYSTSCGAVSKRFPIR